MHVQGSASGSVQPSHVLLLLLREWSSSPFALVCSIPSAHLSLHTDLLGLYCKPFTEGLCLCGTALRNSPARHQTEFTILSHQRHFLPTFAFNSKLQLMNLILLLRVVIVRVAHVGLGDVCRLARGPLHRLLGVREQGFSNTSSHWVASGARSARPSLALLHPPAPERLPHSGYLASIFLRIGLSPPSFAVGKSACHCHLLRRRSPLFNHLVLLRSFGCARGCFSLFFQRNECVEVGKHPKTNPDFAGQRISTSAQNDTLANQHKKKHEQSHPTWS